jgi:hypothetical protein
MLTGWPLIAAYRTSTGQDVPGGQRVSRADVAHAVPGDPEAIRQSFGVAD